MPGESRRPSIGSSTSLSSSRSLFERMYREQFAFVLRVITRLGVPHRDAVDVAQEVFLRVYERMSSYDVTRPAKSWLYAFAIHIAIDYCALRRHRSEEFCECLPAVMHDAPSAEQILLDREKQSTVRQAIEQLPPELRAVLMLHAVEEKTMPEIVQQLGIPLNTGYSRLRRAREKLRTAVRLLTSRPKSAWMKP